MAEVKLTFSGSNEALKRAALESAAALERLQATGERLTAETGKAQASAERFIESLKREALAATMGEQAIRRYQLEKANLTESARREATALLDALDAHKRHDQAMERAGAQAEALGRRLGSLANAAATATAAFVVLAAKQGIAEAVKAEQSQVRLEGALRATGHAAGWTGKQIEQMVQSLAKKTRFDDEQIRDAAGTLTLFRNIGGDQFPRALESVLNLATAMRTDASTAAMQLGRALEDPERNLQALTRAGVTFSTEQRATIKTMMEMGRESEAMDVILDRVSATMGGQAVGANIGLSKATSDLTKEWDDFLDTLLDKENAGQAAIDFLTAITDVLRDFRDIMEGADKWMVVKKPAAFATDVATSGLASVMEAVPSFGGRLGGLAMRAGGQAAQRALLAPGEDPTALKGALAAMRELKRELESAAEFGEESLAKIGRLEHSMETAFDRASTGLRRAGEEAKRAGEKAENAYKQVKKSADSWITSLEKEAATLGMSVEQKKLYEAAQHAATLRTEEERKAYMDRARAALETLEANRKLQAQMKEEDGANADRRKEREKYLKSLEQGTEALQRELDALVKHNDEFGKSREQIERETLAKMENKLATVEVTSATEKEREALEKRIALQKRLIDEGGRADVLRAGKKEADELARAYDRAMDQIEQSLTDAILNGGKSGAELLEGMFRSVVLRPLVEYGVSEGMNMVGSLLGSPNPNQRTGLGANLLGGVNNILTGSTTIGSFAGSAFTSFANSGIGMSMGLGQTTLVGQGLTALGGQIASFIPYIGPIIAAASILRSVFDDGPENPRVQLAFGGQGGVNTHLGRIGFAQNQGGIDTAAAEQYFRTVTGMFNPITSVLGDDAMSRVQARLAGATQREFAFPEGDPTAQAQILNETLRQIGIAVFEEVNPALADFLETLEATDDRIPQLVQGFIALTEAGSEIDRVIMQISDGVMGPLRAQLDALETQQERARGAFEASLAGDDPMAIAQAQQDLMAAVVQRYQAEMQMVRDLMAAIEQVQQAAYEFSLQMAQRINSVGGSIDTGAIAMGRATAIRGALSTDPGQRAGQIQNYVGAIDTWYAARRAEIESRMDREAEAAARANAAYAAGLQAQQAINAARISGLQQELALTQQWQGLLDRTTQIIDQMRLTAVNPLAASGRLGLAEGDAELARVAYQSATGEARPGAAGRFVDALQRQLGLLGEVYQRPSMEYQAGYNDIIRQLTEVQGEARTEAERALDIQAEIERLTQVQNDLTERIQYSSAATAAAAERSSAELDALDEQARGYYEWARDEGEAAFAEQERRHREQLDAITGGMEPTLYMAQRADETIAELKEIRKAIATALANWGSGGPGGDGEDGEGGAGRPVVVNVDSKKLMEFILPAVDTRIRQSSTVIKRAIANA